MVALVTPKLPPLLINKGPRGGFYVYTYHNVWDAELKRSKRVGSHKVGVIYGPSKEGKIEFSPEFIEQYPELKQVDCFREDKQYVFKEKEPDIYSLVKYRPAVQKHAGATWALDCITALTPIGRALQRVFSANHDDRKILSLAYFMILQQNNNLQLYPEFAESTRLPYPYPLDPSSLSRLLQRITTDKIERFMTVLNDLYFKEHYQEDDRVFLAFDSTSIATYSTRLAKSAWGHNKDLLPTPQVNVLLLTDEATGIPVFYRTYDGSVPDVATLSHTLAQYSRINPNCKHRIVLVSDKGYVSTDNINACLINNFSFIFNTKIKVKGSFIQDIINEHRNELLDADNYIPFLQQNALIVPLTWKYDAYPIAGKNKRLKDEVQLYVYLYYSPDMNADLRRTYLTNAATVKAELMENKTLSAVHAAIRDIYLDVDYNADGSVKHVKINNFKLEEQVKYCGIRALISDCKLSPVECYAAYEERAQVEYAFHTLKSRLSCNRLRCHSDRALEGKAFVQILASTLALKVRSQMRTYTRKVKAKDISGKIIYDSDNKILAALNNVMAEEIPQGGLLYSEISASKRAYFEALNVPLPVSGTTDEYALNDADITEEEPDYDQIMQEERERI